MSTKISWLLLLLSLVTTAFGLYVDATEFVNSGLVLQEAMSWLEAPYLGAKKKNY